MTSLMFLVILASLFILVFVTKRRFGVLGLALAAGAVLSASWAETLTPVIAQQGVSIVSPPLLDLVSAGLILAPPLLLLFSGPSYQKSMPRTLGAIAFSVLGCAFLLEPLGDSLKIDSALAPFYNFFSDNQNLIIVAGLILALVDILLTRKVGKGKK